MKIIENPNPGVNPWASWKKIYDSFPFKDKITAAEYKNILQTVNLLATNKMIYEGKCFKLPYSLGRIGVKKLKSKRKIINWQASDEDRIFHNKNYSEGYTASLYWKKKIIEKMSIPNSSIWRLRFSKDIIRNLFRAVRDENTITKYYDI
jgi:hypothetical protein